MRVITLALVLAATAIGLAACGGGSSDGGGSSSGNAEVGMTEYYFQPAKVQDAAGKTLTLTLKNTGTVEHNFTLDEQNVSKDVEPGEQGEVTVTVPDSGQLVFYCKYHRQRGMTGLLTIGKPARD
jgi:plastocyanin